MFFVKNDCQKCACFSICKIKDEISTFRNDLMKMEWYGNKKYVDRKCLEGITVKLDCRDYIDKAKLKKDDDNND